MKVLQGSPSREIDSQIIGKITKTRQPLLKRKNFVFVGTEARSNGALYAATLSSSKGKGLLIQDIPPADLEELNEGDVVCIHPDGSINVLWEIKSIHNCCLLTEACNCNCIMCPQPPKKDDPYLRELNLRMLSLVDPTSVKHLGFTGGEPTLFPERLVELMSFAQRRFTDPCYDVLTNGIAFANFKLAKKIALATPPKTTYCISMHADVEEIHEKMTRARGSFSKVIKGIQNLAKLHQAIEIRSVITRYNFSRLESMALYIYRNFPFVVHVAFMGMEIEGYAEDNYSDIWIDPAEYAETLSSAVWELHRRGINVSIYNIPLCLLPRESWRFARRSISDWKKDYLEICSSCSVKSECCGVFSTSGNLQSNSIKPIDNYQEI